MDWDKLRIFHAVAQAGSFTHAGDALNLSQSAVSRQIGALEESLSVPLFHRHARGLILTEQGEVLYRTVRDVFAKLTTAESHIRESRDRPQGRLRVTTTVAFGSVWLTSRVKRFLERYPDIDLSVVLADTELDLAMRQAEVALRMTAPTQPDLIQRRLFTVHLHVYAAPSYINRHGKPNTVEDLARHRLVTFGEPVPPFLKDLNSLQTFGMPDGTKRTASLQINDLMSIRRAVKTGAGIAMLPEMEVPSFDTFFVYPEAMKNQAKLKAFRDFLFSKARSWAY